MIKAPQSSVRLLVDGGLRSRGMIEGRRLRRGIASRAAHCRRWLERLCAAAAQAQ